MPLRTVIRRFLDAREGVEHFTYRGLFRAVPGVRKNRDTGVVEISFCFFGGPSSDQTFSNEHELGQFTAAYMG